MDVLSTQLIDKNNVLNQDGNRNHTLQLFNTTFTD